MFLTVSLYRQLLLDCGIGLIAGESSSGGSVVGQHRALIFCQLKSMLDIVENDLLKYVFWGEDESICQLSV